VFLVFYYRGIKKIIIQAFMWHMMSTLKAEPEAPAVAMWMRMVLETVV